MALLLLTCAVIVTAIIGRMNTDPPAEEDTLNDRPRAPRQVFDAFHQGRRPSMYLSTYEFRRRQHEGWPAETRR